MLFHHAHPNCIPVGLRILSQLDLFLAHLVAYLCHWSFGHDFGCSQRLASFGPKNWAGEPGWVDFGCPPCRESVQIEADSPWSSSGWRSRSLDAQPPPFPWNLGHFTDMLGSGLYPDLAVETEAISTATRKTWVLALKIEKDVDNLWRNLETWSRNGGFPHLC